jgi:hypothetical protein
MTDADIDDQSESEEGDGHNVGRRRAITGIALGTGAVIAGAVGGAAATASGVVAGGWKKETVEFDVACLGETWRDSLVNYAENDSDFRGMPFSVEGWIYPAGTIPTPGDGYVPTSDGSIGRWLCRGSVLVYADRFEPHVQTTQEFVFGPMAGDQLFPDDLITTSGLEGTFETSQTAKRSVVGGTGRYAGATGEQFQSQNGFNTSVFTDGTGNAPSFWMRFDLLLPDV